ncbi:hypothetical protein H6P81_004754 [Aristolochia fimbriata]|uniref:APO domain-containing protein n=1 Tax=Aristolochia fimbriata TaxID=158543 RepID=A0AAV7ESJ7_ARIFI|nr:hypothetical protein H6P81_004754 [Aristolochia fimbriata]
MQQRHCQNIIKHSNIILECFRGCFLKTTKLSETTFSTSLDRISQPKELPMESYDRPKDRTPKTKKKHRKHERKPFVTDINELKRRARLEKIMRNEVCEISLKPPENGLLVKKLIPVAHEVYSARNELLDIVPKLIERISLHACRVCGEVHVGLLPHGIRTCNTAGSLSSKEHSWVKGGIDNILPVVESFHLYDRVGRAVSHEECLEVDRIPAIVELCVQAGLDLPEYPTRRRMLPVYNISGRLIDFEKRFPQDARYGVNIKSFGFWEQIKKTKENLSQVPQKSNCLQDLAVQGMLAWDKMRSGALRLMLKYPVQTCGYCPEVQVGPKGHRARLCQAFKHQMRDGQHAWQEASIDDIVPPVYVWHVRDPQSSEPLVHSLKRYYGKLPAVVELFWQAGAQVGEEYDGLMREDVVVPDLNEEKLVV